MRKIVLLAAVFAGLLQVMTPVTSFAASNFHKAEDSSGFSGVPGLKSGGADLTRSRFTYQLNPAQTVSDQFYVKNTGTKLIELLVFAADATTDAQGVFTVQSSNEVSKDVGAWVRFQGGSKAVRLSLKAGQDANVPFTLKVPNLVSPGDHIGGIGVSTLPGSATGQINLVRAVITRLYARVRGNLSPLLTVSNVSATYTPSFSPFEGTVTERFTISNVGNVSLSAKAAASVDGPFGIALANAKTFKVSEIAPGTKRDFELSMTGVGQWVFLHPSVKLTTFTDKDALYAGKLPQVVRDVILWVFPTTIFVFLVFAAIVAFIIRSNIRNRQQQVKRWLAYTEAEARRKAELGS